MTPVSRRQGWRVLEFAARIAQEDEHAALHLLQAAAWAFPVADGPEARTLRSAVGEIGHLLRMKLDVEDRGRRSLPPPSDDWNKP